MKINTKYKKSEHGRDIKDKENERKELFFICYMFYGIVLHYVHNCSNPIHETVTPKNRGHTSPCIFINVIRLHLSFIYFVA